MSIKLEKLQNILKEVNRDTMSEKDFVRAFAEVVKIVKAERENLREMIAQLGQEMAQNKGEIGNTITSAITEIHATLTKTEKLLTDTVKEQGDTFRSEARTITRLLTDEVNRLESDIADKSDVTEKLAEIEAKIPTLPEQPDINGIIGEAKESFAEELKKLRDEMTQLRRTRAGGGKKITSVRSENLTSQVDGVKKTFTMPADTLKVIFVAGTQFPIIFDGSADFTFVGRTLTLTDAVSAPASGQTLVALIETAFYSK